MARAAARAADGCSRRAGTAILPAVRSQCAVALGPGARWCPGGHRAWLRLAASSLLFWTGHLPLLPRANVSEGAARRGARRALLQLLHPLLFAAGTHFFWGHHGGRGPPACGVLFSGLMQRPAEFGAVLADELQVALGLGQP